MAKQQQQKIPGVGPQLMGQFNPLNQGAFHNAASWQGVPGTWSGFNGFGMASGINPPVSAFPPLMSGMSPQIRDLASVLGGPGLTGLMREGASALPQSNSGSKPGAILTALSKRLGNVASGV